MLKNVITQEKDIIINTVINKQKNLVNKEIYFL